MVVVVTDLNGVQTPYGFAVESGKVSKDITDYYDGLVAEGKILSYVVA
jgi:hypothetical protein